MDALKFIEERRRMCKTTKRYSPIMVEGISPKDIVKEVEEWSAAHPRKTRQSVFLEQWPTALLTKEGTFAACPMLFSSKYRNADRGCASPYESCDECRREFWSQEVH